MRSSRDMLRSVDSGRTPAAWRNVVAAFAQQLTARDGFSSVKDLCRFLLEETEWRDGREVIEYLRDYQSVSSAQHKFHSKWLSLRNMENIAAYDLHESEKVGELIEALSHA